MVIDLSSRQWLRGLQADTSSCCWDEEALQAGRESWQLQSLGVELLEERDRNSGSDRDRVSDIDQTDKQIDQTDKQTEKQTDQTDEIHAHQTYTTTTHMTTCFFLSPSDAERAGWVVREGMGGGAEPLGGDEGEDVGPPPPPPPPPDDEVAVEGGTVHEESEKPLRAAGEVMENR